MNVAKVLGGTCIALWASGLGCLSMQSQSTLDDASGVVGASNQPYVETYIEYPGPQQKWMGPASFILHVTAKDSGPVEIAITPALIVDETSKDPTKAMHSQRHPAGSAVSHALGPIRKMTGEEGRDRLTKLAASLQGAQVPFRGCMSPVRVRMIRADGGIFEKQGCRSEQGWSRAVSEAVNAFIDASVYGVSAPAVAKAAQAEPEAAASSHEAERSVASHGPASPAFKTGAAHAESAEKPAADDHEAPAEGQAHH